MCAKAQASRLPEDLKTASCQAASSGVTTKLEGSKNMDSNTRPGTPSASLGGQAKDDLRGATTASSISGPLARGSEAVGAAANDAMNSAGSDLKALRNDLNSLRET